MKLNKARHPFSMEVTWNIPADFQPIPLEDAHKQPKNVHPYMQLYFIEEKMKNLLRDWYDQVLKIPSALTDVGIGQFTTIMGHDNLKLTEVYVAVESFEKRKTTKSFKQLFLFVASSMF